jgi:uncharacterized membrane protein
MKNNFISEYLPDESLDKISAAIGDVEKKTSGEIRLCIKRKRGFLEKKFSPREIALKEFVKSGMNKTVDKTGVMIFILLEERMFEIIADEGINSKIPPSAWNVITNKMKTHFWDKNYLEGLISGINNIGEFLINEFPVKADDRDELSNEVIIQP